MLSLTLPYPPSVNHYWRYGQGRHWISAEGKAYRVWVRAMVRSMALQPLRGRLQVTVTLHARDRRKRDIDNGLKAVLDAMEAARVYQDDSQIDDLHVVRGEVDRANPRAEVTLEEVDG